MNAPTAIRLPRARGIPAVDGAAVASSAWAVLRALGTVLRALVRWSNRHLRWVFWLSAFAFLVRLVPNGQPAAIRPLVFGWFAPALVSAVWSTFAPSSYERIVAGPSSRLSWVWWARRSWPHVARECGLSVSREVPRSALGTLANAVLPGPAPTSQPKAWIHPRLCSTTAKGVTLTITVRARTGQTVDDLEKAAPALAAAARAKSWRCRVLSPSTLEYVLVMADRLRSTREAEAVTAVSVDAVTLGRRQGGTPWALPVVGRHTLVVGCSGSGKGSIFWGVCGGLAPAVSTGLVRLWGVDLKRGVEVGMGRGLFSEVATTPGQAVEVLSRLLRVIDERGHRMAGQSRLHKPTALDPLHVLAIDELAVLTAYADPDTRKEASRLLAEVLTQGRALGVVVLACVQDPRKEVVGLRGLFTQTVALRLRSPEETRMVLGDGTAVVAPAHRISASAPGTAWVIDEDGSADKVRADFWPDELVRSVAARHRAPYVEPSSPVVEEVVVPAAVPVTAEEQGSAPAARKPRTPRKPRQPRAARVGGEAA